MLTNEEFAKNRDLHVRSLKHIGFFYADNGGGAIAGILFHTAACLLGGAAGVEEAEALAQFILLRTPNFRKKLEAQMKEEQGGEQSSG